MTEKKDPVKQATQWLNGKGYPIEFRSASIFRAAGFAPVQARHFMTDTGPREVDLYTLHAERSERCTVSVVTLVECKWSLDRPWVVFSGGEEQSPYWRIASVVGSVAGQAVLNFLGNEERLQGLRMFRDSLSAGFAVRTANESNAPNAKDLAYEALQSLCSVSDSLVSAELSGHEELTNLLSSMILVLPLIVVHGSLVLARFDDDKGEMVLSEVPSARILWDGAEKFQGNSVALDVVTLDSLPRYLEGRSSEIQVFASAVRDTVDALLAKHPLIMTELGDAPGSIRRVMERLWDVFPPQH